MHTRIKSVRTDFGMSQSAFAERLGISRAGVQKLESGENNPSEQTIRAICREFGINRMWLETNQGDMHSQAVNLEREIRDIMNGQSEFKQAIMISLASMDDKWWQAWEEKLQEEIAKTAQKKKSSD